MSDPSYIYKKKGGGGEAILDKGVKAKRWNSKVINFI